MHTPQLPSEDYRGSAAVPTDWLLPSAAAESLASLASSVLGQLGEVVTNLENKQIELLYLSEICWKLVKKT